LYWYWLGKYGEAIYETRPWYTFGEGPTKEPEGHFQNRQGFLKLKYSWKDVRYTTKDKIIYATLLGWPGEGEEVLLSSFATDSLPEPLKVESVTLIGSEEELIWDQSDAGLSIKIPAVAPDEMAVVFKIEKH